MSAAVTYSGSPRGTLLFCGSGAAGRASFQAVEQRKGRAVSLSLLCKVMVLVGLVEQALAKAGNERHTPLIAEKKSHADPNRYMERDETTTRRGDARKPTQSASPTGLSPTICICIPPWARYAQPAAMHYFGLGGADRACREPDSWGGFTAVAYGPFLFTSPLPLVFQHTPVSAAHGSLSLSVTLSLSLTTLPHRQYTWAAHHKQALGRSLLAHKRRIRPSPPTTAHSRRTRNTRPHTTLHFGTSVSRASTLHIAHHTRRLAGAQAPLPCLYRSRGRRRRRSQTAALQASSVSRCPPAASV